MEKIIKLLFLVGNKMVMARVDEATNVGFFRGVEIGRK